MSKETIISLPESVEAKYITTLIRLLNVFYRFDNAEIPHFYLRFKKVKKIDVLGVLVIYKFLEYSIINNCFLSPTTVDVEVINEQVREFGFESLIASCYNEQKKMIEAYGKLRSKIITDKFLVSPIIIFSGLENRDRIEYNCFETINKFYGEGDVSDMIFMVISELIGNFYSHSNDKSRSIIVAYGTKDYVEIACADAGIGIVESLRSSCHSKDSRMIMRNAFEKGVSSKPRSDHMGYGLWMIDETIRKNAGYLIAYSRDAYYERKGKSVSCVSVPIWKGTIVYLRLNTANPVNVKDIIKHNSYSKLQFR